jgi:hypothetical protein
MNKILLGIMLTTFVIFIPSTQASTNPNSVNIAPVVPGTTAQVGCLTQMTQMAAANCTNSTSGQNYCTSQTTAASATLLNGLEEMNGSNNGGELCPGTYNASFGGCWMTSGGSCGGGSCGSWSVKLNAMNQGTGNTQLSSNGSYWYGTGGNSTGHYNPNEGVTFFMPLPPFNGPNVFYHTGTMENLYFTITLENDDGAWQNSGTIQYCILSLYQISNNPKPTTQYP